MPAGEDANPEFSFPEVGSDSARNKILTGVCGLVLGLIFLAVGIAMQLKHKKGEKCVEQQPLMPAQAGGSQVQGQPGLHSGSQPRHRRCEMKDPGRWLES